MRVVNVVLYLGCALALANKISRALLNFNACHDTRILREQLQVAHRRSQRVAAERSNHYCAHYELEAAETSLCEQLGVPFFLSELLGLRHLVVIDSKI